MAKKKNILFILADDQRFNTVHALGNEDIITPNIDSLVHEGTSFTRAHIPCGTSGAVCMPSRAMLLTGRTLFHLQGEGQEIPEDHTTMGEALKENGYDCFGTGKWHNGPSAFARSFTGGENIFFGGMWDHWNVPICHYDRTGEYDNEIDFVSNFTANNEPWKIHCDAFNPGVHSSELLSKTAIDFLETRSADDEKPFFCYLAYLAPHDPRTMPERFKKMYDPAKITLPENWMEMHPFRFGIEDIRDEMLAPYPRTEEDTRKQLAEYYGMITHLDDELGKVLQTLKDRGLYEDTIIVYAADNGLNVGSHGLFGKQNHYEESIRVPLIFRGPGIPKNEKRDGYVYLLDVFPTLCDMTGTKIPASVEGRSFAGMFTDPEEVTRDSLYFCYNDLLRSVKKDEWKLIEYRVVAHRKQLFNLAEDPEELNDLAEKYPGKVEELEKLLYQYRSTWEDHPHRYSEHFWHDGKN